MFSRAINSRPAGQRVTNKKKIQMRALACPRVTLPHPYGRSPVLRIIVAAIYCCDFVCTLNNNDLHALSRLDRHSLHQPGRSHPATSTDLQAVKKKQRKAPGKEGRKEGHGRTWIWCGRGLSISTKILILTLAKIQPGCSLQQEVLGTFYESTCHPASDRITHEIKRIRPARPTGTRRTINSILRETMKRRY